MTKILKIKVVLITHLLLLIAAPVFAAETFFETKNSQTQVGDTFEIGFFLNTENEDINAIEGKVIFPKTLLKIKEIRDGNSIINFWIEQPKVVNEKIAFSGIIPGGYFDKRGLIFSLIFQSIQEGQGLIEIRDIRTLLNDGQGTEAKATASNLRFVISKQMLPSQPAAIEKKDTTMPEGFAPVTTNDPTIFDGKYFLVFATQDKGSGIEYYEVCEGQRKCVTAESPYLLQNQNLDEEIIIKAVDKSGNERIVTLPAQKPRVWHKDYEIIVMLILTIVAYLIWKILWKKRRK